MQKFRVLLSILLAFLCALPAGLMAVPPAAAVVSSLTQVNVQMYGARGDNTGDDGPAIASAIASVASSNNRTIYFPPGAYRIASTIQINTRGIRFIGNRQGRVIGESGATGGSRLNFVGTGACVQIGTDNGHPYDQGDYDGYQGFSMQDMSLKYTGASSTALTNGMGTYGTGTIGIRDWRGGDVLLQNVSMENFGTGFWGIQSDINRFVNLGINYCHLGLYIGPRSDQFVLNGLYTTFNDVALQLDRINGARIEDCQFVGDGNATDSPVKVGSAWSTGSLGVTFQSCWFEHYQGAASDAAFVDIASSDSVTTNDVYFRNTTTLTGIQGATNYAKFFLKIGNATKVWVDGVSGDWTNFLKPLDFVGTTSPDVRMIVHFNQTFSNTPYQNDGSGSPSVFMQVWGSASQTMVSPNGRFYLRKSPPNVNQDMVLSTENADRNFFVLFPDSGGNTTLMRILRRVETLSAAPTTNTWDAGDLVFNSSHVAGAAVGWICTVAGTPGTWKAFGFSPKQTTVSATGTVAVTDRITAINAANITLTLPASSVAVDDLADFQFKDITGSNPNTTIAPGAGCTMESGSNYLLDGAYGRVTFWRDGTVYRSK